MARHDVHVLHQGDVWAVIREGDDLPVSLHPTREAAAQAGRLLAADGGVAFVLHEREGRDDVFSDDPRA